MAKTLSKELHTTIYIKGVDIDFFKSLVLEGVYVEDLHNDTLLYLSELKLGLSKFNRTQKKVVLNEVVIKKGLLSLCKYQDEKFHNFQFILDSLFPKDSSKVKWVLEIGRIEVQGMRFKYINENDSLKTQEINYQDLLVKDIHASIKDFSINVDTVYGKVITFRCAEKSGFVLNNISAMVKLSPDYLSLKNLELYTPESDIKTDLHLSYSGYSNLKFFNDSVLMRCNFLPSRLSVNDLSFFSERLKGFDNEIILSGLIKGSISRLKGENISLKYGKKSEFNGNFNLTGLPDVEETFIRLRVEKFLTTQSDLSSVLIPSFSKGKIVQVPNFIESMGDIKFIGDFTGFFNDFVAYGNFQTNLGNISSDILLKKDIDNANIKYTGRLSSHSFDVGKMVGVSEKIGRAAFDLKIEGLGLGKETAKAHLDGIISGLDINKYYYENIELKGDLANKRFNGSLIINEKNIGFDFKGEIDYSTSPALFKFNAVVNDANLANLNFITTIPNPVVSATMTSNLSGENIDNMVGNITLSDIKYRDEKLGNKMEFYSVGDISLSALKNNNERLLELKSDFVIAEIKGRFNYAALPKSFTDLLGKIFPSSQYISDLNNSFSKSSDIQDFDFYFQVLDDTKLLPIFYPELKINNGSKLYGHFNSEKENIEVNFISDGLKNNRMEVSGINWKSEIKELVSDSVYDEGKILELSSYSTIKKVKYLNSYLIENLKLDLIGTNNNIRFATEWSNNKLPLNQGVFSGNLNFETINGNKQILLVIDPTAITILDSVWNINGENIIKYKPEFLAVNNLKLNNSSQSFQVNGSSSLNKDKGINLVLENFDVSALNIFQDSDNYSIEGIANGNAVFYGIFENLYASGNITVKKLALNKREFGTLSLHSSWRKGSESLDVNGGLVKNQFESMSFSGKYAIKPNIDSISDLDLIVSLKQFKLNDFEPFVSKVFSKIDKRSSASGDLHLTGTLKAPFLTGKLMVQKGGFTIDYLNTKYTFEDEFVFTKNQIAFEDLKLNDIKGNFATVSGGFFHKNFKEFSLDLIANQEGLHSLNTSILDNELFYGQAYGSGDIHIKGPLNNLSIEINSSTEEGTQISIPLSNNEDLSSKEYIVFVNGKDTNFLDKIKIMKWEKEFELPHIKINLDVLDNADVQLIFDEMIGDVLKAKGNGNLQLDVKDDGVFKIFGTYTISEGDYLFTLQKIINKRFKIEKGSTITWSGDPYEAIIDIKALYLINASLYDLTLNDEDKGRIPVECILKMKGQLMNPEISFDIEFPGLDEGSQSSVQWLLNTEEINKQIFSLLVLGQFQPSDNSLIAASGGVGANSSELLSNQLSNWLSKISEDFDIGVNYRPGDEITSKEIEIALSTQLFDGRLMVNGSVANNSVSISQNPSNIVGDFNLEYLIAKDSDVRLKAYNRSNDSYLTSNYAPYTQGIGVSFKKEFNKFSDLFKKTNKNKNVSK